jgi:hypothetical protein
MNISKDSSFSLTQNYSSRTIISENFSISKSNNILQIFWKMGFGLWTCKFSQEIMVFTRPSKIDYL